MNVVQVHEQVQGEKRNTRFGSYIKNDGNSAVGLWEMPFGHSKQERDGKELGESSLVTPWAPSVGSL